MESYIRWAVDYYEKALRAKTSAKILWDSRSIHRKDWLVLKKFFKEYPIKTVLEYGCGLSTELMVLEGLKVTSLETIKYWADTCRRVIGNEIILYEEGNLPYIEGMFDIAFVDGPKTKRTKSILHAIEHSNIIYLHDLRPTEVALLDNWKIIEKYGNHFYEK